ncbi:MULTISPECIES: L,D-transpeptidase [unclassified Roseitalea]|uniref:L,D-transpeptidase n=1 Tax=unclassified Roseitalea TaxID=2639107 RepID=UPI00273D116D|nr:MULTISPECIES: L,D-transpeptidase [unclassified Roseitalea]
MISRRAAVAGIGTAFLAFSSTAFARQVFKDVRDLEPGEYTWAPDVSPAGPVAVIVSIPEQLVHVYRNGIRIAVSTCSTGKPGHATPTGVFTVLQKDADHRSSTYNNAPMPNMNRLTWSGIALHAGNLPGYPASHGCIRLPLEFSRKLFEITHIGTPVIIAGSHTDPWDLVHPGMVLGGYAEHEFEEVVAHLDGKSHPSDWQQAETSPIATIIASSADLEIMLIENGEEVVGSTLTIDGPPILGEHVLVFRAPHPGQRGMAWHGISHHEDPAFPHRPEELVINRIRANADFIDAMQKRLHPGLTFIITDLPTHPERQSGSDFVIMTTS